jgi:hypothetical protein
MTRYAKSHTEIDLARRLSILLAFGLFFMTRYAPDSVFFLILQVNTRERYRKGGNISLKKSLLLEEKGKAKRSPSMTEKLQQAFRQLVLPDARRFSATFPRHSYEKGVYHTDSSSSCVRGMSNPTTHITRLLLETERSRRRKREKQKLVPYKIYSLCRS